jgi:GT2 family glycosyltransferase
LSAVIVNYRCWVDTIALVRQFRAEPLLQEGSAEVVVVDNHSPALPIVRRLRHWSGVSLRRWGRNRGFARAANEGCRLSRGEWLLLLNPDVGLPEGFLETALARAQQRRAEDPHTGILGFGLQDDDGTQQYSAGPFPSLSGLLARRLLPRSRRKYHALPMDRPRRVPWVTGCCVLIHRDCFRAVGGFDEDFFLYYEDVDLCRRAHAAGWSVWYDPALQVVHRRPLHRRAVPPQLRVFTRHALLLYAHKHWPRWQAVALATAVRGLAWLRRRLALHQGDDAGAEAFGALGSAARLLAGGRTRAARRCLDRLVSQREAAGAC